MREEEQNQPQNNFQSISVQNDPYGPSYPQSAARFMLYRIGLVVLAICMIILGKSNLPEDAVTCIQDVVINGLQPVTNFYIENNAFGTFLLTLMVLVVDLQLIGMAIFWYLKGESFRYPIIIAFLGICKILLNVQIDITQLLFEIKPIDNSFPQSQFLTYSLTFGSNFKNTYFFSGVITFLLFNLLEFRQTGYKILMYVQTGILAFCFFLLLTMRMNFFMDVVTALVFGHYVFVFVADRAKTIDSFLMNYLDGDTTQKELE